MQLNITANTGEEIKAPQRAAMPSGNIIEKEEWSAERQRENIMRWNRIQSVFVSECVCMYAKSFSRSMKSAARMLVGELWSWG